MQYIDIWFIMVIELSGVQFGLKSYAVFFRKKRNRKRLYISMLKSSVKISVERNKGKNTFDSIWLVVLFLCLFSLAKKKKRRFGAKDGAIRE